MSRLSISVIISFICILTITPSAPGQTALEKTRREIERLEKEIKNKQNRERTVVDQIEDVNREIGLRKKLLKNLDAERKRKERDIRNTTIQLQQTRKEEAALKNLVGRRMVTMYKHGRKSDWEMLLTLTSVNQMLVWMKYQKLIIENDKRNLRLLNEKQAEIEAQTTRLQKDLNLKEQVIIATRDEANKLENRRSSRQSLLNKIRNDASALRQQLEDRRKAYSQIAQRIQRERSQSRPEAPGQNIAGDGKQFLRLKGKMNWPVTGKIVNNYGRQRNPVLKTETENLGIDIKSLPNAAISPPCPGVVKWVTWQRGMGNLVLVDHGGDYYTVYGYLDMVLVDTGTEVDTESIIGHVGDQGSLYGPTLHFEVWNGTRHQNPSTWLR